MSEASSPNSKRTRLVVGIFLILLGGVLLAANLGYALPFGWWRFYPFILMSFGVLGLATPSKHLDRAGGVWLLASGIYCAIGEFDLFNLGWWRAWPVFVIAAGASFVLRRHADDHAPEER